MYPLRGDHKLPEKLQAGVIKIPDKINPVKPQQSEREVRNDANFPIVTMDALYASQSINVYKSFDEDLHRTIK